MVYVGAFISKLEFLNEKYILIMSNFIIKQFLEERTHEKKQKLNLSNVHWVVLIFSFENKLMNSWITGI